MKLIRKGNCLLVDPWCPVLKNTLTYKRRVVDDDAIGFGLKYKYISEKLYTIDKSGDHPVGFVAGGCYNRICRDLQRHGIKYSVSDKRDELPEPDYTRLKPLRTRQDTIIAAFVASHSGVIEAPTGIGKTFIIEQLTRIYPDQKFLIISTARSVVDSIFERVSEGNPEAIVSRCCSGKKPKQKATVVVCTAGSIHRVDPQWPDIVIFDECHGAGARSVCHKLSDFVMPRMFGFSASPGGRSDGSDRETEGLFGEAIITIEYDEAQRDGTVTPLEVRMLHVKGDPVDYTDPICLQRFGYWQNDLRNRAIANTALNFPDVQVLILVKTVEHVLHIRKYLPHFQIVHAGIAADRWDGFVEVGLVQEHERDQLQKVNAQALKAEFASGALQHVIATQCWKEGVDFPDLAVMIRGDGAPGNIPSIQIAGRLSRISDKKCKGLLIDFLDDFGHYFTGRSARRQELYVKKKWNVRHDWYPTNVLSV